MARYIDADLLIENIAKIDDLRTLSTKTIGEAISNTPTADVVEVKDCEQCIHSGKQVTEYPCSHCRYCYKDKFQPRYTRTPKERGADKQKITCLNCKHFMFSDMYGECYKQLKIVNPSDTCEFAEPKERGGEK